MRSKMNKIKYTFSLLANIKQVPLYACRLENSQLQEWTSESSLLLSTPSTVLSKQWLPMTKSNSITQSRSPQNKAHGPIPANSLILYGLGHGFYIGKGLNKSKHSKESIYNQQNLKFTIWPSTKKKKKFENPWFLV